MTINNKKKSYNILLCACKSYTTNQKNGILLIEPELKENKDVYHEFYETDFEVHCFCQINDIINENIDNNIDNTITIKKTRYFLVGGFNREKGIGVISLYKFIFDKKNLHIKIKETSKLNYKNLIKIEELESVNCIIQTKNKGNFLISCLDGNVYSFKFDESEF